MPGKGAIKRAIFEQGIAYDAKLLKTCGKIAII